MSLLKSARVAIDGKDFTEALRLSEKALSEDPSSYNALVFMGISLENLARYPEGISYYERAIKQDKRKPLAYQGLCSILEKQVKDGNLGALQGKVDLGEARASLASVLKDSGDIAGYVKNLNMAIDIFTEASMYSRAYDLHLERLNLPSEKENHVQNAVSILQFLHKHPTASSSASKEICALVEDVLSKEPSYELIEIYLQHAEDTSYEPAHLAIRLFPQKPLGYEHFLRVYIRNAAFNIKPLPKVPQGLLEALQTSSSSNTVLLPLFKAVKLHVEEGGPLEECKNDFKEDSHFLLLRARSLILAHDYQGALKSLPSSHKMDSRLLNTSRFLRYKALYLSQRLSEMGDLQISPDRLSEEDAKEHQRLGCRVNAFNGHPCPMIEGDSEDEKEHQLRAGILAYAQDRPSEAMSILKGLTSTYFEAGLLLGLLYKQAGELREARLVFLKSLSLNPGVSLSLKHLGLLYYGSQDTSRALKCLLKALELNPEDEDLMRTISLSLEDSCQNKYFLEGLLERKKSSLSSELKDWISLRLGILYLNERVCNKAICHLQRINTIPRDGLSKGMRLNALEALGDAYMLRSSFYSALKTFEEAAAEGSLYALLQIAHVRYLQGDMEGSIRDYESLPSSLSEAESLFKHLGLSRAYHFLAATHFEEVLDSKGIELSSLALSHALSALSIRGDLSCLWKNAVSCLIPLVDMSEDLLLKHLSLPMNGGDKRSDKASIRRLAAHLALRGLSVNPKEDSLWHDYGIICYLEGKKDDALRSLKHAVSLRPGAPPYWNSLGLAAFHFREYELSQHAFIKALTLDGSFPLAWTNLGLLYLTLDKNLLANRAFQEGQSGKPFYPSAWSAQSILAKKYAPRERIPILQHAALLGLEPLACYEYGAMIVGILKDQSRQIRVTSEEAFFLNKLHGIPTASDSLEKFLRRFPSSARAWSLYGVLLEAQGLHQSALRAYLQEKALISSPEVLLHIARVLHKLKDFSGSSEALKASGLSSTSSDASALLSLNYYCNSQLKESYINYQETLKLLQGSTSSERFDVLLALSSIALTAQGPPACHTLLNQAKSLSERGNLSLVILGIKTRDVDLILNSLRFLPPGAVDSIILQALVMAFYQKKPERAFKFLLKAIHIRPDAEALWRTALHLSIKFSQHVLRYAPGKRSERDHLLSTLSQFHGENDRRRKRRSASRYLHQFPYSPQGRSLLLHSLCQKEREEGSSGIRLRDSAKGLLLLPHSPENKPLLTWLEAH